MNCEKCPFFKEHNDNFIKLMKSFKDTTKDTKDYLGEGAYESSGKKLCEGKARG